MTYSQTKRKTYTIADIAKVHGVSKTTVYRALKNKSDILPETRDKILKTAEKYHYQPNALAQGMTSQRSNTIGVFIPHDIDYIFMNPFYQEIIRGIFHEADELGFYMLLIYCHQENYLDVIYQKRVDGLLVISPGAQHHEIVSNIKSTGIPFVLTSRMPNVEDIAHVCVDNYTGALLAVNHLISLGHKRIGFINGPDVLSSSADRLRGYRNALIKSGIQVEDDYIFFGKNNIDTGYQQMKKMLMTVQPTAVFVAGDLRAFAAMRAIHERGLSIPDDISIVGFDNITLSEVTNPPLTTIDQHIFEKGRMGVKVLVELISGHDIQLSTELDAELVIRDTSGPAHN